MKQFSKILKYDIGNFHACVIDKLQGLVCWGENNFKQLDIPSDIDVKKVQDVVAGYDYTCIIYEDSLRYWGASLYDALNYPQNIKGKVLEIKGTGINICLRDEESIKCWGKIEGEPQTLPQPPQSIDYKSLEMWEVGGWNACARDKNNLHCWLGGFGLSLNKPDTLPLYRDISISRYKVCVLTNDDLYICWGLNDQDFATTWEPVPIKRHFHRP